MPGLRYSVAEGGLISIIIPDDEADLAATRLIEGEALLVVSADDFAAAGGADIETGGHAGLQALLNRHTGKTAAGALHAVVDSKTGTVEAVVLGWPSLAKVPPGFEAVPTRQARAGDQYLDGKRTDDDIARVKAEKEARAAEEAAVLEAAPEETDLGG